MISTNKVVDMEQLKGNVAGTPLYEGIPATLPYVVVLLGDS